MTGMADTGAMELAPTAAPATAAATSNAALAAALQAAELAHERAELLPGLDTARRAWRLAETVAPASAAQARAGYLVAHALYRLGRFHELGEHGANAALLLREQGQAEAACHVLRWVALGVSEIACFAEALHAAQLGLTIAESAGHAPSRVLLTNALAACFERMGDPWQAERLLGDALALATERCGDEERFVCMNNLCAVSLTRYYLLRDGGDDAEARVALEHARAWGQDAEALASRVGDPFYSTYVEANLGDALGFLGEHEAAEARLGSALRRAQARRFVTLIWRVQCSLGELAVERGRMGAARDLLQPLIAIMGDRAPQTTLMRAQGALYRALRALGDTEGALQVFERFHRAERQRSVAQLQAQAAHLVTRLEVEQSRREARAHQERANALEEVAIRDPLTSLVNRRGCERHLRAALRGVGVLPATTVAMIDIDHFKIVNDVHGHAARRGAGAPGPAAARARPAAGPARPPGRRGVPHRLGRHRPRAGRRHRRAPAPGRGRARLDRRGARPGDHGQHRRGTAAAPAAGAHAGRAAGRRRPGALPRQARRPQPCRAGLSGPSGAPCLHAARAPFKCRRRTPAPASARRRAAATARSSARSAWGRSRAGRGSRCRPRPPGRR
ncbi:MAG: GGDEF domain-containing protein [Burkholderiaceae bacterium]